MKSCSNDYGVKSLLLTGANGFFGKIIQNTFKVDNLLTLGLADCDINVNLAFEVPKIEFHPDMVIHAAGKAHVNPRTESERKEFFDVNVEGTLNLLRSLDSTGSRPNTFVYISSVSVYGLDRGCDLNEDTPLNGRTPYAKSKIEAEKIITEWGDKYGVNIVILRLPLMVGVGAPGNFGSMYNVINRGYYFRISSGKVHRSMVLAQDVAAFISKLNGKSGIYHLTDGYHPAYFELENVIAESLGKQIYQIPVFIARFVAFLGDYLRFIPLNTNKFEKLSMSLTFNDSRARKELGWNPSCVLSIF